MPSNPQDSHSPEDSKAFLRVIRSHDASDGELRWDDECAASQSAAHDADSDEFFEAHDDSIFAGTEVAPWECDLWEDPKLAEIASQLSIDANYLEARFPADSNEDRVASLSQPNESQPNESLPTSVLRSTRQRSRFFHRQRTRRVHRFLAAVSLALLLIVLGRPIWEQSSSLRQADRVGQTSTRDGKAHDATHQGTVSALAANLATEEAPASARLAADKFQFLDDPNGIIFPRVASASATLLPSNTPSQGRNASPTAASRNGAVTVTPVIYQPEVLFHASQAELEGILDIVRPEQDGKIRVAF